MRYSVAQDSRIGGRRVNEDRVAYVSSDRALLLLLADGMGGHPKGDLASRVAIEVMAELFQAAAKPCLADVSLFLQESLLNANDQLVRLARAEHLSDYPRTTLVAAVIQDGRITWIHCGDSRLYLLRQGQVYSRTLDHSLAERDRQLGREPASQLVGYRNALFTCIGSESRPIFNVAGPVALRPGDRVVLCSDGVWSVIEEQNLIDALQGRPVDVAVPGLVEQAVRRGGPSGDNASCVVLAWPEQDDFPPTSRQSISVASG